MPLLVEDLMYSSTKSVIPETSLAEVMSLMRLYHVDCLPVAVNKCLVGYVRLRDILDILFSEDDPSISKETGEEISNLHSSNAPIIRADIRRVIFDKLISVTPSTPVDKAISLMQMYQVSSLAVIEANKLAGMVSLEDINRATTGIPRARSAA